MPARVLVDVLLVWRVLVVVGLQDVVGVRLAVGFSFTFVLR